MIGSSTRLLDIELKPAEKIVPSEIHDNIVQGRKTPTATAQSIARIRGFY